MIFYIYAVLSIILAAAYLLINANYIRTWASLPTNYYLPPQATATATIVVVARNESQGIERLLLALSSQDYPAELYQIIVVDDDSQDDTAALVLAVAARCPAGAAPIRLLHLSDYLAQTDAQNTIAFKKKAIAYALQESQSDWIVCTDADCEMGAQWLSAMLAAGETTHAAAVLAPVLFEQGNANTSFILRRFQQLDLLGMMVITAVGVKWGAHLANGANLAYRRSAFETVGGFAGQENMASGDDMLLLHKIAAKCPDPNAICFVLHPLATVTTALKTTWRSLWAQRLRWATKSRSYNQKKLILILATVWLFSFSLFCTLVFALSSWSIDYLYLFIFQAVIKLTADYFLLRTAADFFARRSWLKAFLVAVWLHWAYILLVGAFANFVKKYEWKGRRVQ
jgi:poly-beta-1,6-N-acetyl-D-glucosamine synthase